MQVGIIENGSKLSAVEVNTELYYAVIRANRVYDAKMQAYYPSRASEYRMKFTLKPDANARGQRAISTPLAGCTHGQPPRVGDLLSRSPSVHGGTVRRQPWYDTQIVNGVIR